MSAFKNSVTLFPTVSSIEPHRGLISIVVPIFNEAQILERFHRALCSVVREMPGDFELIYVDDGSGDSSLQILLRLQKETPGMTVVELSRNWGHQAALTSGLRTARGDAVILMDGDFQDPPESLPQLVDAWKAGGQVVVAERTARAEIGLRKILIPIFYRLLRYLSDFPIPLNAGIFGLVDRQVVDAINNLAETNRFIPGLRAWTGFRTSVVLYERKARADRAPKQTLTRLLRYGLDAIFSFSYKPLRLSLVLGIFTGVGALVAGIALTICRIMGVGLFGQPVVVGYTTTIVSILFLAGVQLVCIGILGEYLGRIYDEVKRRPLYFVQKIHVHEPLAATTPLQVEALAASGSRH